MRIEFRYPGAKALSDARCVIVNKSAWHRHVPFAACISLIILVSLLPADAKRSIRTTGGLHPWGHIVLFALLLLLCRPRHMPVILRATLLVCFGLCLEFTECAIYQSRFEWKDVRLDAFGVGVGTVIDRLKVLLRWYFRGTTP